MTVPNSAKFSTADRLNTPEAEPAMPSIPVGAGKNLAALNRATDGLAIEDRDNMRARFVGVISCYVPPEIWDYAVRSAVEQVHAEVAERGPHV